MSNVQYLCEVVKCQHSFIRSYDVNVITLRNTRWQVCCVTPITGVVQEPSCQVSPAAAHHTVNLPRLSSIFIFIFSCCQHHSCSSSNASGSISATASASAISCHPTEASLLLILIFCIIHPTPHTRHEKVDHRTLRDVTRRSVTWHLLVIRKTPLLPPALWFVNPPTNGSWRWGARDHTDE